jgi:hypothetical protein
MKEPATTSDYPIPIGFEPVSISVGDVSGEGAPDIAVACQAVESKDNSYRVYLLLSTSPGVYTNTNGTNLSLQVCKQPTSIAITDTDSNGKGDLVISCTGDDKLQIVQNMGFPNILTYDVPTDPMPRNLNLTDINGDGILDIIVPSQSSNTVDFFLNNQGMGFQDATKISKSLMTLMGTCTSPYLTTTLDVDGDGRNDIGVAGLGTAGKGCISVFFNQSM